MSELTRSRLLHLLQVLLPLECNECVLGENDYTQEIRIMNLNLTTAISRLVSACDAL